MGGCNCCGRGISFVLPYWSPISLHILQKVNSCPVASTRNKDFRSSPHRLPPLCFAGYGVSNTNPPGRNPGATPGASTPVTNTLFVTLTRLTDTSWQLDFDLRLLYCVYPISLVRLHLGCSHKPPVLPRPHHSSVRIAEYTCDTMPLRLLPK